MGIKMDEETLMARELAIKVAAQEREGIFQRYDLGREPGNQIDPWEDPQFSVYDKTDRYALISTKTNFIKNKRKLIHFFLHILFSFKKSQIRLHPRHAPDTER
jgi:hypothetical protein